MLTQPTSFSESNTEVIFGMAVAMIVLSVQCQQGSASHRTISMDRRLGDTKIQDIESDATSTGKCVTRLTRDPEL